MHTSWLVSAAILSTCVSAFYPLSGEKSHLNNRFFPLPPQDDGDRPGLVTFGIHRRRSPAKRTNNYPVVLSKTPDIPNAMAIDEDGQDFSYFSVMEFGSKAQQMYMLIDTGSSNTWVYGTSCTAAPCLAHNQFGKTDSKTLNTTTTQWSLTYGTGTVEGVVASDTVAFANYSIELGFGLATDASTQFNSYPMDGILGLGRPASDELGTPTVMEVLATQNLLQENVIGIHLQRESDGTNDGQITFGGIDTSQFVGKLAYTDALANDGNWEIPVDDASVNGTPCNFAGKTGIIDTGTSYILMPPADAAVLHKLIPGSVLNGQDYEIPCTTTDIVQLTFSGITYDIGPQDYMGAPSGGVCLSNIIGHQAFGPNQWIVGDVFLKNVYAVFDFDNSQIGFGSKAGETTTTPSSTSSTSSSSSSSSSFAPGSSTGPSSAGSASGTVSPSSLSTSPPSSSTTTTPSDSSAASAAASSSNGSPFDSTGASNSPTLRVSTAVLATFVVGAIGLFV